MATWQFDLHMVPRRKLAAGGVRPPAHISAETFDTTEWWQGETLPADYDALIASFLPPRSSWHVDLRSWGEEDGNRIDVYFENGCVVEVLVRVDARVLDQAFLSHLAELANRCSCLLVTSEMEVLPPLTGELAAAVQDSAARKFVIDPEDFFRSRGAE